MDIGPPELVIILVIVLVLFGGKKIPEMARSLGQAQREFHKGANGGDESPAPTVESPALQTDAEAVDPAPVASAAAGDGGDVAET
jgi:sec-independent protein translocase protein TatA